MVKDVVIVRDWKGRALKRTVDSVHKKRVFVLGDTKSSVAIGCPVTDVFERNASTFKALEAEWERDGIISQRSWGLLSPYRFSQP